MKTNPKFVLIVILLGSLITGILSSVLFYNLGSQSLAAVKSPEENPAQKLAKNNLTSTQSAQGFKIIKEKDILVTVYNYVYAQKQASKKK